MTITCDVMVDDPRWVERVDVTAIVNTVVAKTLNVTKRKVHPQAEVSFSFSDDSRIRELNAQWRGKPSPTNVLSFPCVTAADLSRAQLLGDVVLAFETIEREATEERKIFAHHTTHMVVHGFLHLLGFDHETDAEAETMEGYESRILMELGFPDPWGTSADKGTA